MNNKVTLLLLLCLTGITANAQENYFKVIEQSRIRPEFRKGYKTLSPDTAKAAFFIAQRTRLAFDYNKGDISMYSSIQDIRTWGDEEQQKDNPGLSVNELWIELNLHKNLYLKAGRQELVYDDQRLLGNADWSNATRSHDALLLKLIDKKHKLTWHTGAAFNQNGEPLFGTAYTLKNYKYLGFSWFKKEFTTSSLSLIAVLNGLNSTVLTSPHSKASITPGALYHIQKGGFEGSLGGYYQTGKTENNLSLSAYMLNVYAQKRIKKTFAGIGFDYLSGDDDNMPASHSHNFSTLYATNHKFYGYMDYFINIPADTKQRGLADTYLRLGAQPGKKITTTIDIHRFLLAHENHLAGNNINRELGYEIDALLDLKASAVVNIQAGYSMMLATRNMEMIKGGNSGNYNGWAFIMLKITPVLFSTVLNSKI